MLDSAGDGRESRGIHLTGARNSALDQVLGHSSSSVLSDRCGCSAIHGKEVPTGRHEVFTPWPRSSDPTGTIPPWRDSGVRLSDLLVSLSLATDLGFGQPSEHMLRSARIGMRLGERLGLDTKELATLFDVSILTYVGCPVYGNEAALLFGDDIDFRADALEVDLAGFPAMVFMLRRAGHGTSAFNRARQAAC